MNKSLWIPGVLLLIHLSLLVKGLHSSPASSRRLLAQDRALAETPSAPSTIDNSGQTSILPPRSRTVTIVVVAIFVACIFVGFFSVYARKFCISDEGFGTNYHNVERSRNLQELVASLPVVQYGGAMAASEEVCAGKNMRECSVCLSEFEEGEELRLLPACDHLFHKDCIDMWLFSHTTCPLCRLSLVAKLKRASSNSHPPHVPPLAAGDHELIHSPLAATPSA